MIVVNLIVILMVGMIVMIRREISLLLLLKMITMLMMMVMMMMILMMLMMLLMLMMMMMMISIIIYSIMIRGELVIGMLALPLEIIYTIKISMRSWSWCHPCISEHILLIFDLHSTQFQLFQIIMPLLMLIGELILQFLYIKATARSPPLLLIFGHFKSPL